MNKLLHLLLSLSLLCAGSALADSELSTDGGADDTTITCTVPDPELNYIVTIPADVPFLREEPPRPCRFPLPTVLLWRQISP